MCSWSRFTNPFPQESVPCKVKPQLDHTRCLMQIKAGGRCCHLYNEGRMPVFFCNRPGTSRTSIPLYRSIRTSLSHICQSVLLYYLNSLIRPVSEIIKSCNFQRFADVASERSNFFPLILACSLIEVLSEPNILVYVMEFYFLYIVTFMW